jgi:L-fuconolactonase
VSDQIRIDAHQHFWDVESGRYTWPTPAEGSIYRTYTPADLEPELGPAEIDATVLVQTVATLDSMLALADRHPFVGAVVGWVPLADSRAAEAALEARPHPRLRGIRHLIHHEPDPDWLLRGDVADGLDVLTRRGLSFDIVAVFPNHLRLVPAVADRHPDLTLVLDHLGKPPFRSAGWSTWHDQLRRAAARPNVVAKLSGLDTAAGPRWSPEEIRPAVETAIDAFGPGRLPVRVCLPRGRRDDRPARFAADRAGAARGSRGYGCPRLRCPSRCRRRGRLGQGRWRRTIRMPGLSDGNHRFGSTRSLGQPRC